MVAADGGAKGAPDTQMGGPDSPPDECPDSAIAISSCINSDHAITWGIAEDMPDARTAVLQGKLPRGKAVDHTARVHSPSASIISSTCLVSTDAAATRKVPAEVGAGGMDLTLGLLPAHRGNIALADVIALGTAISQTMVAADARAKGTPDTQMAEPGGLPDEHLDAAIAISSRANNRHAIARRPRNPSVPAAH